MTAPAALGLFLLPGATPVRLNALAAAATQTIFAYPSGGGSYIVASDNLGRLPGLVAASALLIDYVLTVAVSVASGVAALVSAVPSLDAAVVPLSLIFVAVLAIGNLRGVREAGALFAAPTYAFIGALGAVILIGLIRVVVLHDPAATGVPRTPVRAVETLGVVLVLKAFSSGCTAMTGIEAVSNGVPAFKPPESRNAATTMLWMSGILGTLFIGTVVLFYAYGLVPDPTGNPTMLSQLTEQVVGRSWFYYIVQGATLLILIMAANTSYADFPRLAAILAHDDFVPHLFGFRGDRLAFTDRHCRAVAPGGGPARPVSRKCGCVDPAVCRWRVCGVHHVSGRHGRALAAAARAALAEQSVHQRSRRGRLGRGCPRCRRDEIRQRRTALPGFWIRCARRLVDRDRAGSISDCKLPWNTPPLSAGGEGTGRRNTPVP